MLRWLGLLGLSFTLPFVGLGALIADGTRSALGWLERSADRLGA